MPGAVCLQVNGGHPGSTQVMGRFFMFRLGSTRAGDREHPWLSETSSVQQQDTALPRLTAHPIYCPFGSALQPFL